jgi:FkbM family methyltransferase
MKLFKKLYGVNPIGLVHVGAHLAEEHQEYENSGMLRNGKCLWIEPQPDKVAQLRNMFEKSTKHEVIEALVWSESNLDLTLRITNHSASSSVFQMDEHRKHYPQIEVSRILKMKTSRLQDILPSDLKFDFLILDVQGAELEVIRGLGNRIREVNWIYTEVSKVNLYRGGVLFSEINRFLESQGFRKKFIEWDRRAGWGDALFVRNEIWTNSIWLEFQRCFHWIYRRIYGRIPQVLFPTLVLLKSKVFRWR